MSITSEIRLRIKKEGDVALTQLSSKLNDVASRSVVSNRKFKDLAATLRKNDADIRTKSINTLNDYSRAWRELANSVDVTSREFKEATREAQRFERQAAKAQGRRGGGRAMGLAKGLGSIAAGGIFGGPEGIAGGAIGLALGGPAGAALGIGIGAYVGDIREAIGATATFAAELEKSRIALTGVTATNIDYGRSIQIIEKSVEDFAIPQDKLTRQFTKLQASVSGAGGTVEDTEIAFKGIVAAVRATGGSLNDVDAALTATAQVFSKGKVSAEELRQQIGERLPGAFTLFAQSIGMTPQELDKALEKGQVSLQDFQQFAQALFDRYGETAKVIADSPEAAGDRLQVALAKLSENVGTLLKPIGASFQTTFTQVVTFIDKAIERLNVLLGYGQRGAQAAMERAMNAYLEASQKLAAGTLVVPRYMQEQGIASPEMLVEDLRREFQAAQDRLALLTEERDIARPSRGTGLPGIDPDADSGKTSKMRTTSAELAALGERRTAAARDRNQLAVELINYEMTIQKATEQFNQKQIDFNTAREISNKAYEDLQKRILRLRKAEQRELAKLSKGQKETNKELTEAQKLGQSIVTTFASGMGDALINLIEKAKSFREIMGDLLKQVGKLLINFGMQALGKGLFPSLFSMGGIMSQRGPVPLRKYARGGIANSPQLAMFGEGSTPEAYVPLPDGRSIPVKVKDGGSMGNITVNVDASGSQVQGDQPNANKLGEALGAAVRQELIRQKRPGGLLS